LKKQTLALLFLLLSTVCFGQANYYKFSLGLGFGPTITYADLQEKLHSYGGYGEVLYNFSPFITAGVEFQTGELKGGDVITDKDNRAFINRYQAFSVNSTLALGQFIDHGRNTFLGIVKGAYVGLGVGTISNDMTFIVRYKPNTQAAYPPLGYEFPGDEKSTSILVPIQLGLNFYLKNNYGDQRFVINVNYKANFTFGEGLDGYNDPMGLFKNNAPDFYTLLSLGFKYNFGPSRYSTKIF
jgi:hypothetical protein